jgi:cellulose synthase/poly-beta-1,6-N-acetylglucosamine synthase-like glycosyltransferase
LGKTFASVLIDTYNHERFIEQAILSVLEQDFPASEREIIVVDDGSTDRTSEIVKKFAPHVRLLRKENGGQASAFNAGIPECKGDIIAFLDGDDWWAPGKLKAVTKALDEDKSIGLVGHGITEVYPDGRRHEELLRETPKFRIDSEEGARAFRLRKSFLGTSRLTFRKELLQQIGRVPEELRIEADEYLFTLGGFFSDVLILRESLTFYRLHDKNAFQIADGDREATRRKQKILEALAESLKAKLAEHHAPESVARMVVEWIETEAELIRLSLDAGLPWETVRAELDNYRVMHPGAPLAHWIFKCLALLPACMMPSRNYYALRASFSHNGIYRKAREKWLPFLEPAHADRYRTTRP